MAGTVRSTSATLERQQAVERDALGDDRFELVVEDVDRVELAAHEIGDEHWAMSRTTSGASACSSVTCF